VGHLDKVGWASGEQCTASVQETFHGSSSK
jgi:hypothetical protein